MRFTIKHGAVIDTVSSKELREFLAQLETRERTITRVRVQDHVQLDGNGIGTIDLFKVPAGFEFSARRVVLDNDNAPDPNTGNVPLNAAGKMVEYLRSGTRIEYAVPTGPAGTPQIPGIQTWGAEQGPYLRNGEIFQVKFTIPTSNGIRFTAGLEGILVQGEGAK